MAPIKTKKYKELMRLATYVLYTLTSISREYKRYGMMDEHKKIHDSEMAFIATMENFAKGDLDIKDFDLMIERLKKEMIVLIRALP